MDPWYKVATPRKEVREGRSFNPDELAIALEQVVAGTAPEDYRDAAQFFARTCFTRALREHAGMVLRRLSGRTDNTSPVLTLITQFGGGKARAGALKSGVPTTPNVGPQPETSPTTTATPAPGPQAGEKPEPGPSNRTLRLVGTVPPEVWNRLGTKILPKLRAGSELTIGVEFTVTVEAENAAGLATELRQILQELGLAEAVRVE